MNIEDFKEYMKTNVLTEIIRQPLAIKKTNYIYPDNVDYESIKRVSSYYIEEHKKFTWLKHWKGNIFIYSNPFDSYSF